MKNWKKLICIIVFFEAVSFSIESKKQEIKFIPGRKVGTIQSDFIQEASGIVASRKNDSVLWVHNDSGNSAKVYAINHEGRLVIIRGLTNASIWRRPDREPLWKAFLGEYYSTELMPEPQGEAICFDTNMPGFFTTGEKPHQPIYYFECSGLTKKSGK